MDAAAFVIPINGYSNVACYCPVRCHVIVFFNGFLQVECILLSHILNFEIINYKLELYGTPPVIPKSCLKFDLMAPVLVEPLLKQFIGQEAGLRESIHYFI